MDYTPLLKNIAKHILLNTDEANYFTSVMHYREVNKKGFLLREGQVAKTISYVSWGAIRAYYLDKDGNENIIMFAINDWWVTDMYSFSTGQPALLTIDAIEDSAIFELTKNDLEELYVKVPKFERFFRIIMQNSYVREQLRSIQNLSITAEDRYINFVNKYPQFVQRISQKQIASYLGITPEFLSVIRKKLSKG
jgi:CRP-like cAMP-binding protein